MAKKSLLLVDADSKSLRMLEVSLRKSGFSVTTAIHAADAREKLRHSAPDLIITDTKLPGDENGFDFVANLKSQPESASIPIIFLSSENRLEQKVTGLELGVEDYLTKPIYIKEVLTRVRVLLDKREKQTLEKRERSSSFSGLLGDMGLVDLMQTVEIGRKTGRLFVETRSQKGQVSFKEGKVTDAKSGKLTGERAFYRMLVWNDGVFSMEFGAHDDADVIELSTQGLLMEGMRRVDEWGRLIEQLPPLDHVFEIDFNELVDRLAEIPDEINVLLRLFDGRRTMLQVVDETDFGDLESLEIASKLYFEGLIFDCTDREPAEAPDPHKVEAWLQEPAGARDDDDEHDEGGLLVPNNDSVPPMPAPTLPTGGGILAPPSGAVPTLLPQPASSTPPTPATSTPPTSLPTTETPAPSMMAPPTAKTTPPTTTPPTTSTLPRTPSSALPAALPKTTSSLTPVSGGAAAKNALDDAPTLRPLPAMGAEDPEPRTVAPRSAVGATAWSSKKARPEPADEDEWEDIVAPDEATPADGMSLVAAPPPPPLLPTVSTTLPPLTSPPPPASLTLSPPPPSLSPSPPPPASLTSSPSSASLPAASAAAAELARDLGLSDDELALALSAHESNEGAPTLVDAAPADDEQRLADSIAAQLGDAPSSPTALPPELSSDVSRLDAADRDTDKGRKRGPAATAAATAATAAAATPATPEAATTTTVETPSATVPQTPAVQETAENSDDEIHDRHTRLDIDAEAGISRFGGVSPAQAAGVFVVGFIVVAGLVYALSHGGSSDVVDAGSTEVAAIVDAGSAEVVPVVDAGFAAVVDAGSVVVDAGSVAVVVVDAGVAIKPPPPPPPVDVVVDAGPPKPSEPDPLADYARHLKAADAASKHNEFAKSVRSYKAALTLQPESLAAHIGLGNAYYELDNLEASLVHLEKARSLAPNDPQVYVLLGAVYQSASRKPDAIRAYERYLELAPDGKFARDVKGILRGLKG